MTIFKVMPRYVKSIGDVTDVYYIDSNGKVRIKTIGQKASVLIKKLVKNNCLLPNEINLIAKQITGNLRNNPVYLSAREVFIQIKVRKPRISGDPGYGYINLDFIRNLGPNEISLTNQTVQSTMESMTVISRRIEAATTLRSLMLNKLGFGGVTLDQDNNLITVNGRSISINSIERDIKMQELLLESQKEKEKRFSEEEEEVDEEKESYEEGEEKSKNKES